MKTGTILFVDNDSMTDNDTVVFNSTLVLNTSHKGAMAIGNNGALKNIKFFGSATGADRPTNIEKGFCFFDVELNKPIWWNGESWVEEQDKLISGTNIKTINGTSILGSGNIVISGGGSSSGGGGAYAEVSHGTSDTTFMLTPNTFHVWEEVSSLDLSFADEQAGVANEYLFQFTSGATATTLTLPDGLKWANDTAPIIAENMIYQISVLKGLASILGFNNKAELIENLCVGELSGSNVVFTFQHPVASDLTITFLGEMTSTVTINKGETSVTHTGQKLPEFYGISSITPNEDDSYVYKF